MWVRGASRPRILLTGSSGRIGTMFTKFSQDQDYDLIGMDLKPPKIEEGLVDFVHGDINDDSLLKKAMQGCDVVAHLAAAVGHRAEEQKSFLDDVVPNNIIGTFNVYEMATKLNIPKVVFTSTVQVTEGRGENTSVRLSERPIPLNWYSMSKVSGEDTGLIFSKDHGVVSLNLRLGWVETPDARDEMAKSPESWWLVLSGRDCCEILKASFFNKVTHRFIILDAMSRQASKVRELDELHRILDYEPQDDATQLFTRASQWVNCK